jgi:hypothetical protein
LRGHELFKIGIVCVFMWLTGHNGMDTVRLNRTWKGTSKILLNLVLGAFHRSLSWARWIWFRFYPFLNTRLKYSKTCLERNLSVAENVYSLGGFKLKVPVWNGTCLQCKKCRSPAVVL